MSKDFLSASMNFAVQDTRKGVSKYMTLIEEMNKVATTEQKDRLDKYVQKITGPTSSGM